jgi:Arc/MetJ-type ribon-helix-helix transcriptional regulator
VSARLPQSMINQVEEWAARNDATRSEAIRRLVELGLAGAQPPRKRSKKAASKAREMAGQEINRLSDQSLPVEERERRKRRLTKGPSEFRDMRGDLAKPKG